MMNNAMVKILGSGDAFGSGGRLQTCIYIETGSIKFLIDCGGTALISLKRFGLSTAIIDYIFLSHLHGDHFGGIPIFFLDASLISNRINKTINHMWATWFGTPDQRDSGSLIPEYIKKRYALRNSIC